MRLLFGIAPPVVGSHIWYKAGSTSGYRAEHR